MDKWIVKGILIGLLVGIVLYFIFPQLLDIDYEYGIAYRQQVGIPSTIKSGSMFATRGVIPLLCAAIGGATGFVAYKNTHKK